jgi:tRNA nucleotidyltransferase (CCA-adding enzyme)
MKITIPTVIHEFSAHFAKSGFKLYLVGGAVRNFALNIQPKDWDFATDATPDQVIGLFYKVIPTGINHGTVTVLFKQHSFEVTTLRIDGIYSDNRRPDAVVFTPSIQEDLARRDFSINAMAYCIQSATFHDPFGGLADIDKKIIRTVGNPRLRFSEDALRIMRGARFSSQLNFSIDCETLQSMKELSINLQQVSAERFRDEFQKIISSAHPRIGISCCMEIGAFNYWIPELLESQNFLISDHPDIQIDSILNHLISTLEVLQRVPGHFSLSMILAGLFHDIGKPRCYVQHESGKISFPRHDHVGAVITRLILERLKFPRKIIDQVFYLIDNHMFDHRIYQNFSAMRRFLAKHGYETSKQLIALRIADIQSKTSSYSSSIDEVIMFAEELDRQYNTFKNQLTLKDLPINGSDIQQVLQIPPGKMIGIILQELFECVLDDPDMNSRDALLALTEEIYKQKYKGFM